MVAVSTRNPAKCKSMGRGTGRSHVPSRELRRTSPTHLSESIKLSGLTSATNYHPPTRSKDAGDDAGREVQTRSIATSLEDSAHKEVAGSYILTSWSTRALWSTKARDNVSRKQGCMTTYVLEMTTRTKGAIFGHAWHGQRWFVSIWK